MVGFTDEKRKLESESRKHHFISKLIGLVPYLPLSLKTKLSTPPTVHLFGKVLLEVINLKRKRRGSGNRDSEKKKFEIK